MIFFDKVTETLKHKWLGFFQANRSWLIKRKNCWIETPDGGSRPPSDFILGAINVLEPRLSALMIPFCELNPDADKLIQVLGLDFDPEKALYMIMQQEKQTNLNHQDNLALKHNSEDTSSLELSENGHDYEDSLDSDELDQFDELDDSDELDEFDELDDSDELGDALDELDETFDN
jgi:hypothetical protein